MDGAGRGRLRQLAGRLVHRCLRFLQLRADLRLQSAERSLDLAAQRRLYGNQRSDSRALRREALRPGPVRQRGPRRTDWRRPRLIPGRRSTGLGRHARLLPKRPYPRGARPLDDDNQLDVQRRWHAGKCAAGRQRLRLHRRRQRPALRAFRVDRPAGLGRHARYRDPGARREHHHQTASRDGRGARRICSLDVRRAGSLWRRRPTGPRDAHAITHAIPLTHAVTDAAAVKSLFRIGRPRRHGFDAAGCVVCRRPRRFLRGRPGGRRPGQQQPRRDVSLRLRPLRRGRSLLRRGKPHSRHRRPIPKWCAQAGCGGGQRRKREHGRDRIGLLQRRLWRSLAVEGLFRRDRSHLPHGRRYQ